jgi:hypothetical protein
MSTENTIPEGTTTSTPGAAAAAYQPPPDVREARRQDLQADVFSTDPRKSKAAIAEINRMADPEGTAKADKTRTERAAAMSPAEKRVAKANADPALWDTKNTRHEAARKELREAIAAATTPEEDAAIVNSTLDEARAVFGLAPPELPSNIDYNDYSDWERRFLIAARQDGLDTATARGLRDAGVRLALQVDGAPLADAVIDEELNKFALTARQKQALKDFWREIEGTPS